MLGIIIAVIASLAVSIPVTSILTRNYEKKQAALKMENAEEKARAIIDEALTTAEAKKREALLEAKEESIRTRNELEEEIRNGYRPEAVIAVPVGFVNVVQAKEKIMETGVPYICNRGRKGGSGVAAAICNAVLYHMRQS